MLKSRLTATAFSFALCFGLSPVLPAQATSTGVDIRNYVAQPLLNQMLCQSNGALCITSYFNADGEFEIVYTNGITDYIARSSASNHLVGVVRSAASGQLRCFSLVQMHFGGGGTPSPCTAPPSPTIFPESLPETFTVNVVPWSTELAAENADGTPRSRISGAIDFQNGQYQKFSSYQMNPTTCAQTYLGNVSNLVTVVYVQGVGFGGSLGSQDALVIDEYELGPTQSQNHVERYFYVSGYGRVREASSTYDPNNGLYDLPLSGNSNRNVLETNTIAIPPVQCPQGSAAGFH